MNSEIQAGDVVTHCRSGRRMTVEAVRGKVVSCAFFIEGVLHRREFLSDFLVAPAVALA